MGRVKSGIESNINENRDKGQEITDLAQDKLSEAQESKAALDGTNAVDDETQQAVESANEEARGTAEGIASGEIDQPTESVVESLNETSNEANEYSDQESDNASTASGMTGDYASIGGNLSSQFEQSAQEFQSLSENAQETGEQINQTNSQLASDLRGTF